MLLTPSAAVLNRKFWTAVQAAQAHDALRLDPHRFVVFHFNRVSRTLLCAQTASDAGLGHVKIFGLSRDFVVEDAADLAS